MAQWVELGDQGRVAHTVIVSCDGEPGAMCDGCQLSLSISSFRNPLSPQWSTTPAMIRDNPASFPFWDPDATRRPIAVFLSCNMKLGNRVMSRHTRGETLD